MKAKYIIVLSVVLLLLSSCQKDDNTPTEHNTPIEHDTQQEIGSETESEVLVPFEGYYEYPEKEDLIGTRPTADDYRIPKETLKRMSDEQLAQAVADYPLLGEIYFVSTSMQDAATDLFYDSDAYQELVLRGNGKDALIEKIKELEGAEEISGDIEMVIQALKDIVLNERVFVEQLTEEDIQFLTGEMNKK